MKKNICLPNFFIVGAPKCGTTALSEYLRTHPDIFLVKEKETHYFCFDFNKRYPRPHSLEEYLDLFQTSIGKRILMEASPWYLYSNCAIKKAYEFNPKARFLAMIRSPLEMVPSLHWQLVNNYNEDQKDLATSWTLQEQRKKGNNIPSSCYEARLLQYRDTCKLGQQIQNMFSIVPPEQRMVVIFDDFKSDTKKVYRGILSFLELNDDGRNEFPIINEAYHWRYQKLSDFVITPPKYIQFLGGIFLRLVKQDRIGLYRLLYRFNNTYNRKTFQKAIPPQNLLKEIVEVFSDDNLLLSKLVKRDLTFWLKL